MSTAKTAALAVLVAALAVGAFYVGTVASGALGASPAVAYAQGGSPVVEARAHELEGQTVGEVMINDRVVIRMRTSAGGYTAPERAELIAERLRAWTGGPFSPYDLKIRDGAYGAAELRAHGQLIVTVNPQEAEALGSTAKGLARAWHDNIMMALGVQPAQVPYDGGADGGTAVAGGDTDGATPSGGQQATSGWQPSEPYDDKIVPIVSVGEGVQVGVARVNGPKSKVGDVNACALVETHFQDVLEIDIFVPVTAAGGLDRVQEVGVTGLGDIEL